MTNSNTQFTTDDNDFVAHVESLHGPSAVMGLRMAAHFGEQNGKRMQLVCPQSQVDRLAEGYVRLMNWTTWLTDTDVEERVMNDEPKAHWTACIPGTKAWRLQRERVKAAAAELRSAIDESDAIARTLNELAAQVRAARTVH